MSPLPSKDCVAISHPGQVRLGRTRAGIQTTSQRRRGTWKQMTLLNIDWVPDLAPRSGALPAWRVRGGSQSPLCRSGPRLHKGYIKEEEFNTTQDLCMKTSKIIRGLIKSLRNRSGWIVRIKILALGLFFRLGVTL